MNGNQIGTAANPIDARLSPLAHNGGPTMTHAILPDSPALNAGDNPLSLTTDQRGAPFVRDFGGGVDIGAYELQSANGGGNDIIATGTGRGIGGIVRVINAITREFKFDLEPYPGFLGGVRVAVGDVNHDGIPDIITGAGTGGGPHIKVFDGTTGAQLSTAIGDFFAFDMGFTGGVFVAAGDVSGDDMADVIVGADAGGGPHVKVFSGADGSELFSFFAFDSGALGEPGVFTGGVRVAAGDITGDGTPDIITAAGPGGGPHVRVFDGSILQTGGVRGTDIGGAVGSFMAFDVNFTGGVFVAAGDVSGDGRTDIITGAGAGGGPHVKVLNGMDGTVIMSFFAFDQNFTGGVRVAAADITGDGLADILTAPGEGGGPNIRAFDGATGDQIRNVLVEDPGFTGGIFIAGSVFAESSSPLRLADGFLAEEGSANSITLADVENVFSAALARLEAAGLSSDVTSTLSTIAIEVRNLGGDHVGEAIPGVILLDVDAAGIGWFVDPTPAADEEFDNETLAAVDVEARRGVDLLSVLLHELGHHLGLSDLDGGIHPNNFMAETLTPGLRRLPRKEELDLLFSDDDFLDSDFS